MAGTFGPCAVLVISACACGRPADADHLRYLRDLVARALAAAARIAPGVSWAHRRRRRRSVFWFAGQLQTVEARDQLLEQNAHLQPSEMLAETGKGACTERDVA
jgi:hypothetical protein